MRTARKKPATASASRRRGSPPVRARRKNPTVRASSAAGSVPQPWKARLVSKVAQGAGLALSDCYVGLSAMFALYFGISALLLASIPLDWLCGTSLTGIWFDWYIEIKLTVMAAALLWCMFLLAPAAACTSLLNAKPEKSSWRARPIVGALALNAMLFVGYETWHHIPPRPPWPGEFIVPQTDIYGPRLAILKLELMALGCMRDATPDHCRRSDIIRLQTRLFFELLDKVPGAADTFGGPRGRV